MAQSIKYLGVNELWDAAASSLGEPEVGLEDALDSRMASLREWLEENVPDSHEELAGLDDATRGHIFWHHGYLVALRAVRSFMRCRRHVLH